MKRRGVAWPRLPLLAAGFLTMALGVAAGLLRLGVELPAALAGVAAPQAGAHGALMVCGFFALVIALERAVALGRPWAWAAPLAAATGNGLVLAGAGAAGGWAWFLSGLVLTAASVVAWRRQREPFVALLALAAGLGAVGHGLWAAGFGVAAALPWWLGFLVLTIAGERLELSRLVPRPPHAEGLFALWTGIFLGVLGASLLYRDAAAHALGAALVALAAWLWRYDLARRTVRQRGLPRYVAVSLLAGYAWLAVGGVVAAVAGLRPGTPAYDAALHAWMLGFVFSMVFGHAPVVFPAVLRVALPYRRAFYVPLALLHASVALRLAGDALAAPALTRGAALLSAFALVAFVATLAHTAFTATRRN